MTDLKVFYFLKLCLIFVGSVDRFAKVDKQKIQIHFLSLHRGGIYQFTQKAGKSHLCALVKALQSCTLVWMLKPTLLPTAFMLKEAFMLKGEY